MCAIAGFIGKEALPKLIKMLKILEHRGPDATGLYYNGETIKGVKPSMEDIKDFIGHPPANYKLGGDIVDVAIGHNLLVTEDEILQPIGDKNIIVCDGRIYNPGGYKSTCELILDLMGTYGIKKAPSIIMDKFDGDYSFAFFDGENILLARDPVGVKPLYYKLGDNFIAFASERKALWGVGITDTKRLPPGSALINKKIIKLKGVPQKVTINGDYEGVKSKLKNALDEAVKERVKGLKRVGLVFSGGLDSTILAILLRRYLEPRLYTVGVTGSPDIISAGKAAGELGMNLKIIKIDEKMIMEALPHIIKAIEEFNIMKIGVAMPLYFSCKAAHIDGLHVMFSGQGADELFAGYHRYARIYAEGEEKLAKALKDDIQNMHHVNLERDDAVAMAESLELRAPFLDKEIINIAFNIPLKYKIKGSDDRLRKHILRDIAIDIGIPEFIAKRPKKAAQYGSGADKILRRILKNFDHESLIENLKLGGQ